MTTSSSQRSVPQYGLALDWETTGLSPKKNQGIALGAIIFDTSDFSEKERLYLEIKFDESKYEWTEGAAKVHGLSKEHLEENGVSQEDAAIELGSLIQRWCGTNKVMFLGHNPSFDIGFTQQLFNSIDMDFQAERSNRAFIQLHHVVLDTSALGFITMGLYKSDLLFEKIGFPPRAAHNAMEDIDYTLQTAKIISEVFKGVIT